MQSSATKSQNIELQLESCYSSEEKVLYKTGPFSQVYKITGPETDSQHAIKVLKLKVSTLKSIKHYQLQCKNLKSEYIVPQEMHICQNQAYVEMPFFDQDLRQMLSRNIIPEPAILFFIQDIILIFQSFSENGLIHGNLKPSNILFKKDKKPYVTDAGYHFAYQNKLEEYLGLAIYSAPELIIGNKISYKSDIWSLGLIIYQMVFGYPPWPNRNVKSYRSFIMKYPVSFPHDSAISENLKDFIKKCLVPDQHHRISWKKIIQHPLIAKHSLGNPINPLKIESRGVDVLLKIQAQVIKKNRSIKRILGQLQNLPFDIERFKSVCLQMNTYLTQDQISELFKILKNHKGHTDGWSFMKKYLLQVDFRDTKNFTSRFVKELSEVATLKHIEPDQIEQCLQSSYKDNKVCLHDFKKTIKLLLPFCNDSEIPGIWTKIQEEHSKCFSPSTMMDQLKLNLLKKNSISEIHRLNEQLQSFKDSFHPFGNCTIKQVVQFFDRNNDKKISFVEFREMVRSFFMELADDDLKRMFDNIDRDHSGLISGEELKQFLKSR